MHKSIKDKIITLLKDNNNDLLVLRFSNSSIRLGGELDILVKHKKRYDFIDKIKNIFPDFFVVTTEDENYKITVKVFLLDGDTYHSFNFDIRSYIVKRKYLLFSPKLISDTYSYINKSGIRILKDEYESGYLLARNFSDYRIFSDKHIEILNKTFSHKTLDVLSEIGYYSVDSDDYQKVFISLQRNTSIKNLCLGLYFGILQQIFKNIKRKNHIIVFYGPDGTGKTTLTKYFYDFCKGSISSKYEQKHFFLRKKLKNLVKTNTMIKIKDKKILGTIKNYISFIERLFYYFFFIKLNVVKGYSFILDRFFLDFASKIKRYQNKYSYFLERIIFIFSPRPDIVFFLKGSPEIINARKNELTVDQIKEAYNFYDYLFKKYPKHVGNMIEINVDNDLETVKHDIITGYLNEITNR